MVVVAKELIQKLREGRRLKVQAQRPSNSAVAISKAAARIKRAKDTRKRRPKLTLNQDFFTKKTKYIAPFSGRKVLKPADFYDREGEAVAPRVSMVPLWRLSLRMTRNNAFMTLTDTQDKNRILYWASARTGNLRYSVMRGQGRVTEMLVPALMKAMAEGAQIKYLVFRGTARYASRILRSIKRRGIPVWHLVMTAVAPHNGCRRRKQVRK